MCGRGRGSHTSSSLLTATKASMMGLSCPSSLLMATMRSKGSGGCTVGAHVNTLAAAGLLLGALSQTRGPHVRRERLGQLVVAQPKLQQARAQRRRQRACRDTSEHYCKSVEGVAAPAAPLSAGARSVLLHRRSWLRARESASRAARAADMCEHGDTAAHIARCAALQPAAPAWLRTARNAASAQRTRRMAPQPAGSGGRLSGSELQICGLDRRLARMRKRAPPRCPGSRLGT